MKTLALISAIAALLWSLPAFAQETVTVVVKETPKPPAPVKFGNEMGGHFFIPSHLIEDPFSYTAFGMSFGLGSGKALGPELQLQPPEILQESKWYGYTGLGVGLSMNVRFLEYLSARAVVQTSAYLGTGSGAVLVVGSAARVTGDLGVKGSLPVGEHFRFAATLDVSYGPVYTILIAQGVVDAIEACRADPATCTIDLGTFLEQQDTVTWIAGLSGAWAPLPYLGVIGNLQFIAPTKTGKASISQNGLTLAATVDFDAKPLLAWLPVGMNLTYSITSPIGGNGVTTTQDWGVGVYYTGRPDLSLGLELDWKFNRLQSNQAGESTLAWVNFRYYWN